MTTVREVPEKERSGRGRPRKGTPAPDVQGAISSGGRTYWETRRCMEGWDAKRR